MKKTIAFIPVRGGSKSIPLKNIKEFCGKPMVYWSLKAANEVNSIDEIIVATDSNEIENTINLFSFNKVTIYRRDQDNAKDTSTTESVMLEYISKEKPHPETSFILIQATSPLLVKDDLEKGLSRFEDKGIDSVLSCVLSKRFFWKSNGNPMNYEYENRPRRQDFEGIFMENGAFYINSVKNIVKFKNRLSGKIVVSEMPEYTGIEIDEESDWIIAESLMRKYVLSDDSFKKTVKLFISDVDGVLTDAGMYYSDKGDELKKFNTHDGMAFQILREQGFKTAIVTSEVTEIVSRRAKKLKVDYLYQGKRNGGKLDVVKEICKKENITLDEVAYIGDDINCYELLCSIGYPACPSDAIQKIKQIPNIKVLNRTGGKGVFREFVSIFLT